MKRLCFVIIIAILFYSCSNNKDIIEDIVLEEQMFFTTLGVEETGIKFENKITDSEEFNFFNYEYIYNGGGVAVGDINNDGLTDIYFTGNQVSDKLYLNKGDMKFEDITEKAIGSKSSEGWHTGVSMVDINNDGWLDIYVCRSGLPEDENLLGNLLFINNQDGTFTEKGEEMGVNVKRKSTHAVFFDYDNDGDLDLFVMNHPVQDPTGKKLNFGEHYELVQKGSPDSDVMLENIDGKFIDVTKVAGMSSHAYGLGVTAGDLNNDGWIDLYVSNDYMEPDFLYINNKNKTFTNASYTHLNHMSNFSMGNDIADFNNDGFPDIIAVDMVSEDHIRSKKNMGGMSTKKFWDAAYGGKHLQYMFNTLQMNNGNGTFSDIANMAGVAKTDWSWAPLFVDFDNDGHKDLFITNGYRRDSRDNDYMIQSEMKKEKIKDYQKKLELMPATKIQNYIYKNTGELYFDKKIKDWKLNQAVNSNGAAFADFDNDGDIDLVVNNIDEISFILRNDLKSNNNYLRLYLKGPKNNPFGLGAKTVIKYNDEMQYQEMQVVRGYQSSVEPILHFGLGNIKEIEELWVIWPDGKTNILKNTPINQIVSIAYDDATTENTYPKIKGENYFKNITDSLVSFKHNEDFVNDFKIEVLLPHKMSQLGPFLSKGDVNGDGLEDFYISGSKGYSGELFIQGTDGKFKAKPGPWNIQKSIEEMDSYFFDVDNDGDLDLYVVSGGNEVEYKSVLLYDQLYINDGKGNFTNETEKRLPFMQTSAQRIAVGDIDGDGDLDIFVGGRQTPGYYPFAPRSYLLRNDNGYFTDITEGSPDLIGPGLITQSIFTDFNQDGKLDLICVGEWMPISFFENKNGQFVNVTTSKGFHREVGWWMSITKGDYNGDGKDDYIIGNIGENNKFHPTKEKPLEIYCADFDENGTYDIVLGKYQNNVCYPVRGKQCSTEQMPFISKKFPTYNEFAEASMEKIYGKENLDKALHYSATNFSSVILLSNGNGFDLKKLPIYSQVSPINSGLTIDINKDGFLDFVGVGNNFAAEVETVRYDGSVGVVLLGDGKGNFEVVRPHISGFMNNWDDKDLEIINTKNGQIILVANNSGKLKTFLLNTK